MVAHTGQVNHDLASHIAHSNAQTQAHIDQVAQAVASASAQHYAPVGAPAAAGGTSDPALIAILEKMTEAVTANQSKQSTVATTYDNIKTLDDALTMMQMRASGAQLENVQSAHQSLDMFSRLSGVESGAAAAGDLSDPKKQWHDKDMLHLQHLLSRCQHCALASSFDRTQARLAFLPFFAEKNHCKNWFEHKDPRNPSDKNNTGNQPGFPGKDRLSRKAAAEASRKANQRIKQLEAQLRDRKDGKKPGADKGVGSDK